MSKVLLSVIMPVYNAERYLRDAVKSVLNQTFRDFEFLIVNDGSTDGSLAILQSFANADPRIKLISRPNTGYVVALNEMLDLARGDFIARMDADDIALPTRLSEQARFLARAPNVVVVGCGFDIIDARGNQLQRIVPAVDNDLLQQAALQGHTPITHPCAMMRRDSVIKVGAYAPDLLYAEDLDLWLRLGEIGCLANLPDVLMKYRVHMGSVSTCFQELQLERMREACRRACSRRGVEVAFAVSEHWRPGRSRGEQAQFLVKCGWQSWKWGRWLTPVEYGLSAIAMQPLSGEAWRLLACSLLKRRPSIDEIIQ